MDNRDTILANYDSLHFNATNFCVPLIRSDIGYLESLGWICVEDFLYQIFILLGYKAWNHIIAS